MVLPSSSGLATGRPATATPASLPCSTAPAANLPPTVGWLWRWCLAMKALASLMWVGIACTCYLLMGLPPLPLLSVLVHGTVVLVSRSPSNHPNSPSPAAPSNRPPGKHRRSGALGLSRSGTMRMGGVCRKPFRAHEALPHPASATVARVRPCSRHGAAPATSTTRVFPEVRPTVSVPMWARYRIRREGERADHQY